MAYVINHAKAMSLRMTPAEIIRFLGKVEVNPFSGCWMWTGHKDEEGYGQFSLRGKTYWAHRVSHVIFKGPLAERKQVDHDRECCANRCCVNPDHLRSLSHSENGRDGAISRWKRRKVVMA